MNWIKIVNWVFLGVLFALSVNAEVRQVPVSGIPFEMSIAEWTPPAREFPITQFGAKPDGTPITEAMERAIDACAAAGGGRVTVPAGRWTIGAFSFKSNVALVLDADATLFFPDDPVVAMRAPLRENGRPTLTRGALVGGQRMYECSYHGFWHLRGGCRLLAPQLYAQPEKGLSAPPIFPLCKV